MILFLQLENIAKGKNVKVFKDQPILHIVTDSRKATAAEGAIFFAIKGATHDGHKYLDEVYKKGVRQFVIEHEDNQFLKHVDVNVIKVRSSLEALQDIVAFHRSSLSVPVIGITGSNGKTIVKEWLFQFLSGEYKLAKNPGSYNSQLGVPLSVWQLQPHHGMGIFEAGISLPGEMSKLARVIRPTIGVFTNLGSAHAEGFSSPQQKTEEKAKLFETCKVVIYCKDHKTIDETINRLELPALSWGFSSAAGIQLSGEGRKFAVSFKGVSFKLNLPFEDKASVENCFHCVAVMLYLGYKPKQIQERVQLLQSVPMRLELKEGINQSQVIDDTYNNDLAGLQISLQFLTHQHQKKTKRVILSDILESGLPEEELVRQIAALVSQSDVSHFVGIGKVLSAHHKMFPPSSQFYASTEAFLSAFDLDQIQQEIVLVKGARIFQFERIIGRLQRKVHGTIMEIDLGAVVKNLNFFRTKVSPTTKIMVMVKAFAYGSGSAEIANLLQYHKVDYLGVAYVDEGIELRKNNIATPIMVMNPSEESFGNLLPYQLEPEVYSFKILQNLVRFLGGRACKIHVKLDTGMHRLGFGKEDVEELISILLSHKNLTIGSIFTHLAGADEQQHDEFSEKQVTQFKAEADKISNAIGYKPIYHALNSPGILRLPQFQMDMVRLGIGLYGVNPTNDPIDGLSPVATLKTIVSQIKKLSPGETIGYGRHGVAQNEMTIGTIAIGYADGFSRAFSRGVGKVLINGRRAPVVGNVCMDMTMIDLTGIEAKEGDEVIVFGPQLPIQEVALRINTIPYEILTNTSDRVKRVFVAESI